MADKKPRLTPAKNCVCSHCRTRAHAIPNTSHRRCSGMSDQVSADMIALGIAPKSMRGVWL